jgi:26S proteasome regulatory subunit T5
LDEVEDGLEVQPNNDKDKKVVPKTTKAAIVKTSTRQTVFLPVLGIVDAKDLKPLDLVGVNKDSYLIYEKLPNEYDSRVKCMELEEKPKEEYTDIGGLDKQIQELIEAIVLPIQEKHLFDSLGIKPPKGVLLYGPPGTGKTMIARACAAQTNAKFMKINGSQLVQVLTQIITLLLDVYWRRSKDCKRCICTS